jgi:hypothetical protein
MRQMKMYWALYKKELRFLFLPAVTLVAVVICFMLFMICLTVIEHHYGWRYRRSLIQMYPVIEYVIRYFQAFLPSLLYIPAALLGWSLVSERLAKTNIGLSSLPVRRDVPAFMKCVATVTLGFFIAISLSSRVYGSGYIPEHIGQLFGPVETFLYVLRLLVIGAFSLRGLLKAVQYTAVMSCFIGMVFLADSIAETIGRFRVAVWTFTLVGCTVLFIVTLDIVYPNLPVYFMFGGWGPYMWRIIDTALAGAALGALFVAVGAFLSRYHEA